MRYQGKIFTGQRTLLTSPDHGRANCRIQAFLPSSWLLKISLCFLIAYAIWWSYLKLQNPETFPIRNVLVAGSYSHVDKQALRTAILPFLDKGFWNVNSSALQERLMQLPWVNTVSIHRVWPGNILRITLIEQQPIARFNNDQLLSEQGELFSVPVALMPNNLPWFIGPNGQQNTLSEAYRMMSSVLNPLHVKIVALALSDRQSWRLQLDNGIVILVGRIDPVLRLQRLAAIYSKMFNGKTAMVDTIDLRYSHGMAVHYKPTI